MTATELAAVLAGVILLAIMASVELGVSVALLELGLGVVAGNLFHLDPNTPWLAFVASFASVVLTSSPARRWIRMTSASASAHR